WPAAQHHTHHRSSDISHELQFFVQRNDVGRFVRLLHLRVLPLDERIDWCLTDGGASRLTDEPWNTERPEMRIDLGDAHWYAGLTLLERHLVMSGGPIPRGGHTPEASHRWQQWRHRGPWRAPTLFARRLAEDGLTEERVHDLVHAPIDAIQQ